MKSKLSAVLLLLLAVCSAHCRPNLSKSIDGLIMKYHKLGEFNGTALVSKNNEIIFVKGFGRANFEWGVKNASDTKFRIASITKQFTSMLIMQLVQRGKLDLNAPISKYLKYYRKDTGNKVTVHHLLNHTSGIPNFLGSREFWDEKNRINRPVQDFIEMYCSGDLEFEPGTSFRYSNSGYYLLGHIIEAVTGLSFEMALKENILTPLGMNDTGFDQMIPIIKKRASGYERNLKGIKNAAFIDMSIPYASGSMYSTAIDLMKWDEALYSEKLLKKNNIDLMLTPSKHHNYAYGWEINVIDDPQLGKKLTSVGHGGLIDGFNSSITRIINDRYLIVLLNNTGGAPLPAMTQGITNILYGVSAEDPKPRIFNVLFDQIVAQGIGSAISTLQKKDQNGKGLSERSINFFGYQLIEVDMVDDAIEILKFNVRRFPGSSNAHDSLAEAHLLDEEPEIALKHYQKSLELDGSNVNAKEAIQKIRQEWGNM